LGGLGDKFMNDVSTNKAKSTNKQQYIIIYLIFSIIITISCSLQSIFQFATPTDRYRIFEFKYENVNWAIARVAIVEEECKLIYPEYNYNPDYYCIHISLELSNEIPTIEKGNISTIQLPLSKVIRIRDGDGEYYYPIYSGESRFGYEYIFSVKKHSKLYYLVIPGTDDIYLGYY
jgi:hypothetical protein